MHQFQRQVMADAPSNRLSRTLTRTVAASIVTAGIAVLSPLSFAQQSPAPASTSSSFQSEGIKATFTSISLLENKIVLQFSIQNTRQTAVYLAIISGMGGTTGTMMATNGSTYEMESASISGMSFCNDGTTASTDQQVPACLKRSDESNMTIIDPGQSGILAIIYDLKPRNKAATQTDKVNFALKFVVRSVTDNKPGPPSLVTITFPLIPLASQ